MTERVAEKSVAMAESDSAWPSAARGWYATIVLLLAFTFSFVDRQALNLLVDPIQADLKITDTQISLLQGMAFVVTYILMSVPIGRLVDRFNRVAIMIVGVLVWSATTIACGLSRQYWHLLFARLGVGAGEAALTPAAWSVLADYFPPQKLARPMSVYLMGPYLGAGLAMIAGAQVLEWTREVDSVAVPLLGTLAPWQITFIALGAPGVLIALLLATIGEPKRRGRALAADEQLDVPGWGEVFAYLRSNWRLYAALHIGVPFIVVMLYGLQAWVPTILLRVYDWNLVDAGRYYGVIALVAGSSGVLTGPLVASLLKRSGLRAPELFIAMVGAVGATVSLLSLPWQSTGSAALVCIAAASFFVTLPLALISTVMQAVTPNNMRGVVNGMYVVTTNIFGLALGPTLVALATDYLFADAGAVAWSLACVSLLFGPLAVITLAIGIKPYRAFVADSESA